MRIDLQYDTDTGTWLVRSPIILRNTWYVVGGFRTDLASIPTPLRWFWGRLDRWMPAAIAHDHDWMMARRYKYEPLFVDADHRLRENARALGVGWLRRWGIWAGVRLAAVSRGRQGIRYLLPDLPKIAALAVVLVPLLIIPTVTGLFAGGVASVVSWLAEKVGGLRGNRK